MNLSESDRWFGPWGSAGGRAQEPNENDRKIEAPVEAILQFGQIAIGILIEVEGMIIPDIAVFRLDSAVLTQRKAGFLTACSPEPTTCCSWGLTTAARA